MTGIEEKVWRFSHGHYGGTIADVPDEHFNAFKSKFPKGQFPKKQDKIDIAKNYTPYGQERFKAAYPNSKGFTRIFFADRSKGDTSLHNMIDFQNAHKKGKWE